ncbi:MAG: hypothetical protein AMXMBFR34_14710 [Myxococcaceae bacterium]
MPAPCTADSKRLTPLLMPRLVVEGAFLSPSMRRDTDFLDTTGLLRSLEITWGSLALNAGTSRELVHAIGVH